MRRFLLPILLATALVACAKQAPTVATNTNWELLGNSAEQQHHSDLDRINSDTVSRLGLAWSVDMPSVDGLVGNPLIKDGVIYQSGARGRIFANDLRMGKSLWVYEAPYEFTGAAHTSWGGRYNRGLALAEGNAIVATGDCRLIAVDQKSGKQAWETLTCDPQQMYSMTAAPRVGGGLVFIGNACLDSGATRGYVDAYDAKTGKRAWRFYTVPGDPSKPQDSPLYEMAAKSWGTGWYEKSKGCGSAWDAMVYDPKLDQLYIGTGGPSPFTPSLRAPDAGDELFTNSVVAVKAKTGEYVWHFKEVPNDGWNYESSVGLMVADLPIDGQDTRVVISVPKGGIAYTLDARTGKFVGGGNFTPINWAKGLNADGRPIVDSAAKYWEQPDGSAMVLPSNMGAHGWEPIAFSPKQKLVYIPVEVMPTRMTLDKTAVIGGLLMDFYAESDDPRFQKYGELVAWDPVTQKARWRHRDPTPVNGGLLHSADLVFQGAANGTLNAYDEATGKKLWSVSLGGTSRGAPSTVMLDGEQYLIVASGNSNSAATSSYVARFAVLPSVRSPSRLLAFKLGGQAKLPEPVAAPAVPKPAVARLDDRLARRGQVIFEQNMCVDCHGIGAESAGGAVPDLRLRQPASVDYLKTVVVDGALAIRGMPRFGDLKHADVEAVYAFLVDQAWDAYEAEQRPISTGSVQ